MNAFKVAFAALGLIYIAILVWGLGAHLPNVPTIGVLGILWSGLGWYVTDRLLEEN
jgi:hypothetical protein